MQSSLFHTTKFALPALKSGRNLIALLLRADARYRQQCALRNLPDHLRRDLGMLPTTRWTPPAVMRQTSLW